MRLGQLCATTDVGVQRPSAPFYEFDAFLLDAIATSPVQLYFKATTALLIAATTTTSPHVLRAPLLYLVATMRQDTDKQRKAAPRQYKGKHEKEICNASHTFYAWQYVYIDCAPMKPSAAEDWRLTRRVN